MPQRATTPPFGPTGDGTVYLVMDCEADLQRMVADLLSDQYRSPLRVVAFDTSDGSLCDITADVAREVLACAVESGSCCQPRCAKRLRDFIGLGRLCPAAQCLVRHPAASAKAPWFPHDMSVPAMTPRICVMESR